MKTLITATLIAVFLAAFALGSNSSTTTNPPQPVNKEITKPPAEQPTKEPTPEPRAETKVLAGKVICLDPGHQSNADLTKEPIGPGSSITKIKDGGGASGIISGTPEHKIVLEASLLLKSKLEAAGAKVVMTRTTGDVKLGNVERATIANEANADLFIRVHCDGSENKTVSGASVLYPAQNQWTAPICEQSKKAAQAVLDQLVNSINRKNNGVVARDDITGFNWSKAPVILVEIAFLSNTEEDRLLNTTDFLDKAAQGMCLGVIDYFSTSSNNQVE